MTKSRIPAYLFLTITLFLPLDAFTVEYREIKWDDLMPPEAEFDDPFTRLDYYQLDDLNMILLFRERIEVEGTLSEELIAENSEREQRLNDQGIDIDGLLAMRDQVTKERIAKTHLANEELNDKAVRIPGYLLPLEFVGDKVSEFLLVPYVGACIHTPPPPPNQIVHVKTDSPYTTDGGLFTPVWVSGTIRTEKNNKNLSFVDGASEIPISYALKAAFVKPYE